MASLLNPYMHMASLVRKCFRIPMNWGKLEFFNFNIGTNKNVLNVMGTCKCLIDKVFSKLKNNYILVYPQK